MIVVLLSVATAVAFAQAPGVLHIRVTLVDAARSATPVRRHLLLVSDNPSTREPRRVFTGPDGTVDVTLPPGSYTIESDRPVSFLGNTYQWTQIVEVPAGGDTTLDLDAANAEVGASTTAAEPGAAAPEPDASLLIGKWMQSVVAVWSPTSRATGFVVDQQGLIATSGSAVGQAPLVEVQLSASVKVGGRVMAAGASRDVAIIRVDSTAIAGIEPLPLQCPPTSSASLDDGDEIGTIEAPLRTLPDLAWGEVTSLQARSIETDLRLSFGGAGGPAFNAAGAVVGVTAVAPEANRSRSRGTSIVRLGALCEAVAASRATLSTTAAPAPTRLPVEPTRAFPAEASTGTQASAPALDPAVVASADFDIAFITPPVVARARERSDRTGGRSARSPEAEARLGRLSDFGAWSEYVADLPPVLIVRVTPKLVEGFWKRLAREAARTQGAELPPFKDFNASFVRLDARCGTTQVTPIHPLVLEHRLEGKDVIREGLYVFDPEAFGPQCGGVTLSLYSEKAAGRADTLTLDPKVVERIWQDFAPYRSGGALAGGRR